MFVKQLITVFFILLSIANVEAKGDEIVACIDNYPPYQIIGDTPHGSHVTSLSRLAKVLQKRLVMITAPNFARCVKMLELGQVDVIAGLNINNERSQFAFYAPFKLEDGHVFISSQNNMITHYDDLKGKVIGVPRGTTYFEKFDKDTTLTKISIQNVSIGIQLLLKKRIDVIITSTFVADTLLTEISKEYLATTNLKKQTNKPNISYFGFSKKNQLNLTEDKIITLTTTAFEQGTFSTQIVE